MKNCLIKERTFMMIANSSYTVISEFISVELVIYQLLARMSYRSSDRTRSEDFVRRNECSGSARAAISSGIRGAYRT